MASTLHIAGLALEADWVEAWGTWVGGAGTIAAVIWAMYSFRREGRRNREAEKNAQQLQARTVVLLGLTDYPLINRSSDTLEYYLEIGNYGNTPITYVSGRLLFTGPRETQFAKTEHGREALYRPVFRATNSVKVLAPGATERLHFKMLRKEVGRWDPADFDVDPRRTQLLFRIAVEWSDAHGTPWSREINDGAEPVRHEGIDARKKTLEAAFHQV